MCYKAFWVLVISIACMVSVQAEAPAEARINAFKAILRQFEPMGMMVRGRNPYEKDAFIKYANSLQSIAKAPFNHFPVNSITGNSRAKPEIWSQPGVFQHNKAQFLTSVDMLNRVAHTGDITQIKQRYVEVAQSCKACHDRFRGLVK